MISPSLPDVERSVFRRSAPPERRAANRRRKRKQLEREKAGLRRCTLWVSNRALEGIVRQFTSTGVLGDAEAQDHSSIERALTALLEKQGLSWEL
jgi:hypothetical protein